MACALDVTVDREVSNKRPPIGHIAVDRPFTLLRDGIFTLIGYGRTSDPSGKNIIRA
jgi:hypothetical protein